MTDKRLNDYVTAAMAKGCLIILGFSLGYFGAVLLLLWYLGEL